MLNRLAMYTLFLLVFFSSIQASSFASSKEVKTGCEGKNEGQFTDKDFDKILKESKAKSTKGVIYSWSPHMVLSPQGIAPLKKIAKDMGLEMTAVLDPSADNESVVMASTRNIEITPADCKRLASDKLQELGITIHYPTYIFYRDGKIILPRFQGYETPDKLPRFIKLKFGMK